MLLALVLHHGTIQKRSLSVQWTYLLTHLWHFLTPVELTMSSRIGLVFLPCVLQQDPSEDGQWILGWCNGRSGQAEAQSCVWGCNLLKWYVVWDRCVRTMHYNKEQDKNLCMLLQEEMGALCVWYKGVQALSCGISILVIQARESFKTWCFNKAVTDFQNSWYLRFHGRHVPMLNRKKTLKPGFDTVRSQQTTTAYCCVSVRTLPRNIGGGCCLLFTNLWYVLDSCEGVHNCQHALSRGWWSSSFWKLKVDRFQGCGVAEQWRMWIPESRASSSHAQFWNHITQTQLVFSWPGRCSGMVELDNTIYHLVYFI